MKFRILVIFSGLLVFSSVFSEDGNYALSTKGDDLRLRNIEEIYEEASLGGYSSDFTDRFGVKPGDRVLELGCGVGITSLKLASIVGEEGFVLGTDISESQLMIANSNLDHSRRKNLVFKKVSATDLREIDEKFDVVYVRFLLCHLSDPNQVISEVKKVLKPGGRFVIGDLTGNRTFYSIPNHIGMQMLQYLDKLQFEIQNSNDQIFDKLPQLLIEHGYTIQACIKVHPMLDTPSKRKMLTFNLQCQKNALFQAGKVNDEEWSQICKSVEDLEKNTSIKIFSYEVGHICATLD